MSNEIVAKHDNSQLVLNQSKNLLSITTKVIINGLVDDSWVQRLWAWADGYNKDNYKSTNQL